MTLRVVGGTTAATANGSGGGGGRGRGPVPPPPRAFKEHPLAIHLWEALHPRGISSIFRIATLMSRSSRTEISVATVRMVIEHVRKNHASYGWSVPPVEKGRTGANRKYIAAPEDVNDPDNAVTAAEADGHMEAVQRGMVSTMRTIATNGERSGASVDLFANSLNISRGDKRLLRGAAAAQTGAAAIIKDVLTRMGV